MIENTGLNLQIFKAIFIFKFISGNCRLETSVFLVIDKLENQHSIFLGWEHYPQQFYHDHK